MDEEIVDIKEIVLLEPRAPIELWFAYSLGILCLVIFVVWLIKRNRFKPTPNPETAKQRAKRQLDKISLTLETSDEEEFVTATSRILREYIEQHHQLPAIKSTTEEFLKIAKSHPNLKGGVDEDLSYFLTLCDQVKFAKQTIHLQNKKSLLKIACKITL